MNVDYPSNQECFSAVSSFAKALEEGGKHRISAEIEKSFSYLNGLTDGWANFMQSLEEVKNNHEQELTTEQLAQLNQFISTAHNVVHRQ